MQALEKKENKNQARLRQIYGEQL